MVTADQVTAVLVTRGDVDIQPIFESLPFRNIVVWDNSVLTDVKVYGRYAGIDEALFGVVYVQDDDVILPASSIEQLLAAYEPGHVVCNMPERFRDTGFYDQHALVGFGAVFDRGLPYQAFDQFRHQSNEPIYVADGAVLGTKLFYRTCDVVFTALTPRILVDVPYADREFASAPNRMWRQPDHVAERTRMLELALAVRDRVSV